MVFNPWERLLIQTAAVMIVIAIVALYGAALGFSMRPAARAVLFAAISVAAMQYSAIYLDRRVFDGSGLSGLAQVIKAYAGQSAIDVAPTATTAAFAALVSALAAGVTRAGEQRRRGRRIALLDD
jgi:hypothetical protein